jgi:GWxTD domain-containing protein
MAFTGSVGFAATAGADSSHAIVALALNSDALTFRREGDAFRADYRVSIRLRRDAEIVAMADATEPVRVATLRETSRADESILFQQVLTAPPGTYALSVEIRDLGSERSGAHTVSVQVPSFAASRLAPPLLVYESVQRTARSRVPRLVVNPRGAALTGRDSVLDVYLEAYGPELPAELAVALHVENQQVWSTVVPATGSEDVRVAMARVPTAQVPLGTADVLAWAPGTPDTVRVPIFVGFSDDIPATTYADMLSYLEYFASEDRLRTLRAAPPIERAQVWRTFVRETDPVAATPEHERLRTYFARMRQANASYAEPGVEGWRTDRGKVFLLLGEPDRVLDQFTGDATLRGRIQQWEYNAEGLTLVFEDAMGLNRWRLTRDSEALVAAARARRDSDS